MKIIKNAIFLIQVLVLFFPLFIIVAGKAEAGLCSYTLSESGCTITYDGTGFQSADNSYCSQYQGEVEYAAQGTVCATSPNSCNYSTCQATNIITKCNSTGQCSDSATVNHPWNVCSSSSETCAPTPPPATCPSGYLGTYPNCTCNAYGAPGAPGTCETNPTSTPAPTSIPTPTPTPTPLFCPLPNAVQNVRISCPYCQ